MLKILGNGVSHVITDAPLQRLSNEIRTKPIHECSLDGITREMLIGDAGTTGVAFTEDEWKAAFYLAKQGTLHAVAHLLTDEDFLEEESINGRALYTFIHSPRDIQATPPAVLRNFLGEVFARTPADGSGLVEVSTWALDITRAGNLPLIHPQHISTERLVKANVFLHCARTGELHKIDAASVASEFTKIRDQIKPTIDGLDELLDNKKVSDADRKVYHAKRFATNNWLSSLAQARLGQQTQTPTRK